jgi:tetratricopeptide (TPR) repeat protein
MQKITELKTSQKILLILTVGVLLAAAVFFTIRPSGGEDTLNTAITGGELALTSVGRNYESLTQFAVNNETQASQLLQAAEVALETAKAKLNSVKRTNDDYVLGMLDNYERVVNASEVMSKGVDNLLTVSGNMSAALDYYFLGDYEKASEKASYCLDVLTPLQGDFENTRNGLTGINDVFVPSGQRDRLTLRINQYSNETDVYNQYVLLLRSLLAGKDYLQKNAQLEDLMKQLQSAVANKEYDKADQLRQDISKLLDSLGDSSYQNAADLASQLNPEMLSGSASSAAQQLRDRLRTQEGINSFQNYLNALEQYLQASRLQSSDPSGAQQAINQARGILGQGQPGDPELQGLYRGLLDAFNTLEMLIKGQPPQG